MEENHTPTRQTRTGDHMTDHICHCNICTANRALNAVMETSATPEQKAALEALDESFNAFLDWSANLEMEYHYQIGRIADALFQRGRDVSHILQAIEELKARYQPPPKGTPSLFYGTPLHAPAPGCENNGHAVTCPTRMETNGRNLHPDARNL